MTMRTNNPFLPAPLQRDALYDGIALAHDLRRVLAKRLFKTGV